MSKRQLRIDSYRLWNSNYDFLNRPLLNKIALQAKIMQIDINEILAKLALKTSC